MTILALEFSSTQRSVAVVRGRAGAAASVVSEVIETGAGGTPAFAMIQSALREAQLEREQIEVLAVGLGPGSYTGIRVAISMARGWQLAAGVRVLGISSAEVVAAQAQAEKFFGPVSVVIDAQRNEFYSSRYEISAEERREIEPLRILTRAEVEARSATDCPAGPDITRWFPAGRTVYPRAMVLAQLARVRENLSDDGSLEPIYLRQTSFVKAPPARPTVL